MARLEALPSGVSVEDLRDVRDEVCEWSRLGADISVALIEQLAARLERVPELWIADDAIGPSGVARLVLPDELFEENGGREDELQRHLLVHGSVIRNTLTASLRNIERLIRHEEASAERSRFRTPEDGKS
ncbi:MAG: hypothetical protein IT457_20490 [Planctomycetes bacterium]|nr:hypothetical protein [Planctomycetota bacterium]